MADRPKLVKVGALWLRDGAKGKFMSGKITLTDGETKIMVFKNKFHESGDRKPDYEIFANAEEEQPEPSTWSGSATASVSDDDVPF